MPQEIESVCIGNHLEISAIYYALLQNGYNFYTLSRSAEQIAGIEQFRSSCEPHPFFQRVAQSSCEVYPYWPRAAILEKSTFYLSQDRSCFTHFDTLQSEINAAGNIDSADKGDELWIWLKDFPAALADILCSDSFKEYYCWKKSWIDRQNERFRAELRQVQELLNVCVRQYDSALSRITVLIDPIKCVYSSDYYSVNGTFIFCSGNFDTGSIIHEFLHPIVHPLVLQNRGAILSNHREYPGIDSSYYLNGSEAGLLNAFEEHAVRTLTTTALSEGLPADLTSFLSQLIVK